MNWRGWYHAMGPKRLLEAILLTVFLLFFYAPLMNTLMIAFADNYTYVDKEFEMRPPGNDPRRLKGLAGDRVR